MTESTIEEQRAGAGAGTTHGSGDRAGADQEVGTTLGSDGLVDAFGGVVDPDGMLANYTQEEAEAQAEEVIADDIQRRED